MCQLDRGSDVGRVGVPPSMRRIVGMGGHRAMLWDGGVVQGRCLEGGGGGGEQERESGKPEGEFHSV
jgi:hypothetical protein